MKRRARRPALVGAIVLGLGLRACSGTNTGNAECPMAGWCAWAVDVTLGARDHRGTFWLDGPDLHVRGMAYEVTLHDGTCSEGSGDLLDVSLYWDPSEASRSPDGALHVAYDDLEAAPPGPVRPRGGASGPAAGRDRTALRLALDLTPDGLLTATLLLGDVPGLGGDAGDSPLVEARISGLVSVDCETGETEREIPVAEGPPARVRCAEVPAPQPDCDDVVTSGCGS